MKKFYLVLLIFFLSEFVFAQSLKENESANDFTSHYYVNDTNINMRAEPNLSSVKVGKITTQKEILVNPFLSQTKEKIGNYEGYWLRCYVPELEIYGYVFSQYFEFGFAERRESKIPQMLKWDEEIDQTQFKENNVFISESNKIKVNLPNVKTEFENNIVDSFAYSETEIAYINKNSNIYALKHYWYEGGFYIFFLGTENTIYHTRYASIIYNEDKSKMALYNYGNDMWGDSEVVVFDSKTGKKLKTISLKSYEYIIDLRWDENKLIIDYDKIIDYPDKYMPTILEVEI